MFVEVWGLINSNFITAFFGAIFGSGTILVIDYVKRKRETLADINACIAIYSGLLNSYLMIKRQHSLPVRLAYLKDLEKFNNKSIGVKIVSLEAYLKKYNSPPLEFDLPLGNILSLAGDQAYVIPYIMRAKKSTAEVEEACVVWNKAASDLFDMNGEDRMFKYLGLIKSDGIRDTTFPDTIENLYGAVDDALFFTDKAILALQKVGKSVKPWWCRTKVAKIKIEGQENLNLMPSKDHKPGWGQDLI